MIPDLNEEHLVNAAQLGCDSTGVISCSSLLDSVLDSQMTGLVKIYFPPGEYLFTQTLNLRSNLVISGSSAELTRFHFDLDGNGDLIRAQGTLNPDSMQLTHDVMRGDSFLVLENVDSLLEGDILKLIDEDLENITSSWAHYSTGQIVEVDYLSNDTIYLKNKIRRDFYKSLNSSLFKINPKENIVLEYFSIERLDSSVGQTSNFKFSYARDIKLTCIESYFCNFAHVDLRNAYHITVARSYFKDGFDYGGGGKSYGAMLHFSTSECLIEENVFDHLRHSMILQAGANGNVFGYNYSINPFWTGVILPSDAAGDLVLHGNYPYANLFEGNVGQNIVIDNSHGLNGRLNTFFRNRAENFGIFMNTDPPSSGQNFVANEVSSFEFLRGLYLLTGDDHFEYANRVREDILPDDIEELEDVSYYGKETSEFYDYFNWPAIGIPNELDEFPIFIQDAFQLNNDLCADYITVQNQDYKSEKLVIKIYPNPGKNEIHLELVDSQAEILSVSFYDLQGKCLFDGNISDYSSLPTGHYIVRVLTGDNRFYQGRLVKIE